MLQEYGSTDLSLTYDFVSIRYIHRNRIVESHVVLFLVFWVTSLLFPWWLHQFTFLATVHGVAKSQTQVSNFTFPFHLHEKGNGNPLQCSCLENLRDREPGGMLSMGSHRVGHDWSNLAAAAAMPLSSLFSTFLPTSAVSYLFADSCSNTCEIIPHCIFFAFLKD